MPQAFQWKLEEALRKWRTAEQRLYPLTLAWPEGFERHVSIVRAVADHLASVRTVEELLDAYDNWESITWAAVAESLMRAQGLDLELPAAAAFNMRYREITAQTRRDEIVRRIERARAGGDRWVLIEETHSPTGIPYPPWRRMEMHQPEGKGVHQWVDESLDAAGVEYGVEVVNLDPVSGRWLEDEPTTNRVISSDFDEWKAAVEELKARIDDADSRSSTETR